jgi:beta-aspartyl-peptidase (threonine type)
MEKSKHTYLGGNGALEFAKKFGLELMPDAYFLTDHAFEQYISALKEENDSIKKAANYKFSAKSYGTVGAVAVDQNGNVAAATSTGGTENKHHGRIGDSSMIGTGCYANNETCAISATGDGEYIIKKVLGFHISSLMKYKGLSLQEASKFFVREEIKKKDGDLGFIGVDALGEISMEFNSERMHRAWLSSSGYHGVAIH